MYTQIFSLYLRDEVNHSHSRAVTKDRYDYISEEFEKNYEWLRRQMYSKHEPDIVYKLNQYNDLVNPIKALEYKSTPGSVTANPK